MNNDKLHVAKIPAGSKIVLSGLKVQAFDGFRRLRVRVLSVVSCNYGRPCPHLDLGFSAERVWKACLQHGRVLRHRMGERSEENAPA